MTAVAISGVLLALSGWAGGAALRFLLHRCGARPVAAALAWGACSVAWVSTGGVTAIAAAGWSTGGWELVGTLRQALAAWRVTYGQGLTVDLPPALGLLTAGALAGRVAWSTVSAARARRQTRQTLRTALARHGVPTPMPEGTTAVLVQDAECLAVCLPGGGGTVVVSSAAVAVLRPDELAAVVAHEQAHLHGRHHLATAVSDTLHHAFPRVRLLADADAGLRLACERVADESAAARWGARTVAGALLTMAAGATRPDTGALAAATLDVRARVLALLAPEERPRRTAATAVVLTAGITAAPWTVLAVPAVRAAVDLL